MRSTNQILNALKLTFMLIAILALSNCGFHLRRIVDMPKWLQQVAIVVPDEQRDLEPLLKEQLQAYHIQVINDPAMAHYWLTIEKDQFQQNISSISSSTTPRQYQLIYTVQFKLERAREYIVIPSNEIVISRQITINSNRILGSNDEETRQKHDMQHEAIIQMIYRLSRINPANTVPDFTHGH